MISRLWQWLASWVLRGDEALALFDTDLEETS